MRGIITKALSVWLCLILCIPILSFAEQSSLPDEGYAENIDFLIKTGIIDSEEAAAASNGVRRIDAAVVIARIMGSTAAQTSNAQETKFTDLAEYEADAVYAVNFLSNMKIISGTSADKFSPEEYITEEQTAKILVSVLGYAEEAEEKGGYPTGYLITGNRLGLFSGAELGKTDYLTWQTFAQTLCNAVETDILQSISYGDKPIKRVIDGENLLSNVLKIKKLKEAIVTANDITSLNGNGETGKGYIKADGILFEDPDGLAGQYIGSYVNIYYKANDSGKHVVVYAKETEPTGIITIPLSEINRFDGYYIYYNDGEKNKSIRLENDTRMIVNGIAGAYDSSKIDKNLSGEISVKRSGSSLYNVIIVNQYSSLIIDGIDYTDEILYDKINRVNTLDLHELIQNDRCSILINNAEADFTELSVGYTLAVYKSPDNDYIRIIASKNTVNGVVSRQTNDAIWIDNTEYVLSSELKSKTLSDIAGKRFTVYLNIDNEVIYLSEIKDDEERYGYIIDGKTEGGFGKTVILKIMDDDGTVRTVNVAEKADINDVRYTNSFDTVVNLLRDGNTWKQQLIKYKTSADEEVTMIKTAGTNWFDANDGDFYCSHEKEPLVYRKDGQTYTFAMKYMLDANTKVFVVSPNGSRDEDDFAIKTVTYFTNNNSYNVAAYDTNKGGFAGRLVCWSNLNKKSAGKSSNNIMVDFIASSIDDEGNSVKTLNGIMNGAYTELMFDEAIDAVVTDAKSTKRGLMRGDIVYAELNNKSKICSLILLYDVKNEEYIPLEGTALKNHWTVNGAVYEKVGNYALISQKVSGDLSSVFSGVSAADLYTINLNGSVISVFDKERDEVRLGTTDDLQSYKSSGENGSRIVARMNYSLARYIFVYK